MEDKGELVLSNDALAFSLVEVDMDLKSENWTTIFTFIGT
jgi:hypothetical protein